MSNALQQLLSEHVDEEALSESSHTVDDTTDMLLESLDAKTYEQPTEGEFDHLQTYNQDYLSGLSKEDLDYLHPDNIHDLNAESANEVSKELLGDLSNSQTKLGEAAPVSLLQQLVEGTDADDEDFGFDDSDEDDLDGDEEDEGEDD